MTYATESEVLGREPLTVIEIDADTCTLVYGKGNCNAGEVADDTAQSGAATTITLSASDTQADDYYNGMTIKIDGGTGSGQERVISDYVNATKVATVSVAWTTNPDATSTYTIHDTDSANACYNTRNTCQDTDNYTKGTVTVRFCQKRSNLPVGIEMIPALTKRKPSFAPAKITPGKGIGYRGSVTIELSNFTHHDRGFDPYVANRTYNPETQGTFWGKWLARNKYYEGRVLRVLTGYITKPFSWNNFQDRTFVIDRIDGPVDDKVTIHAKDIFALADDRKSKMPELSDGVLAADLNTTDTSFTLTLGSTTYTTGDYIRLGDEIVGPVTVSGANITNATRAQWGTSADSHTSGDLAQVCEAFEGMNVVDVIDYIFNNYVNGIDATNWIPYDQGISGPATGTNDEWDDEKENWLSGHDLTAIISKPEGVTKLLTELTGQCLCDLWWDEINKKIKLKADAPEQGNATIQSINETEHIVADSLKVKRDIKSRLSRVLVHYEKIDHTGDDKAENYALARGLFDTDNEGTDKYGTKNIKEVFSRWFSNGNTGQAIQLQGRLINRFSDTPHVIQFDLDAADDETELGERLTIETAIEDVTGAKASHDVQIIKKHEIEQGHKYRYIGLTSFYTGLYGFITENSMVDRGSATEAQKQSNAFICLDTGLFADGEPGCKII